MLLRLVISRQPLLQNRTSLPRPCIRNLTSSGSRAVMKAYVSHRLGLSHFPARFDAGIHAEPLCRSLSCRRIVFFQVEPAILFRPAMYSNQTDVFLPQRRGLSFEPITFMAQFIMVWLDVSRSLVVRSTRGADEPFPLTRLLSHF